MRRACPYKGKICSGVLSGVQERPDLSKIPTVTNRPPVFPAPLPPLRSRGTQNTGTSTRLAPRGYIRSPNPVYLTAERCPARQGQFTHAIRTMPAYLTVLALDQFELLATVYS